MKTFKVAVNGIVLLGALLLAGCDNSKSGKTAGDSSQPSMPKTQEALSSAGAEAKKVVSEAASTAVDAAKTAGGDIATKFMSVVKTQGDNVLSSIGQDLSAKAKALVDSCGSNESVKTNVEASLTALTAGKDNQALAPAFQTSQGLGLTDSQKQLAKEVGNLASAFVVQRNFSSLQGSQGDVATLVNSLRGGQYTAALQPLKNIYSNASLTPSQKELIGSIADKYAPSLKAAAGTLEQGLQKVQGLPGLSK